MPHSLYNSTKLVSCNCWNKLPQTIKIYSGGKKSKISITGTKSRFWVSHILFSRLLEKICSFPLPASDGGQGFLACRNIIQIFKSLSVLSFPMLVATVERLDCLLSLCPLYSFQSKLAVSSDITPSKTLWVSHVCQAIMSEAPLDILG